MSILDRLNAALADRYRVEREIGAGGMATVYLARDVRHDRDVALKVLRPELAASLGHERFLREITTTANLRHPHILPLYDSGEAGSFLFYVMPFVDGESLRERLNREKQLSLQDASQIAEEVADALGYAHGRGVIHRDIKPENILLEGGHAVVADFGIARAMSAAGMSTLTETGSAIGTPTYMSPEQASGEDELDGRSDVYALGCVLYEMLAGQPPFTGPTHESVLHQQIGVTARPVRELRASVPAALSDAVSRALAKVPADRFSTLTDFAAAVRIDRTGPVPRSRPRALRLGIAAAAAVTVLTLAAVALPRLTGGGEDTDLDGDVIAVLPFRVGGDPAIDYLRESMLDLLQARLSGSTGPRIVEPRTMLAAWRRAVDAETQDLSEDESLRLARALGAGRILLGSAVATPVELTLSGTLVRVLDGATLARESVSGAPDSVAVLVNRLTAALLISGAGETRERQAGLAAAPLDALQDYLAGRRAARRGDYFGAMELYGRAFERDSTFIDAAFAMVATNAWIGTVYTVAGYAMIPTVARQRDRLSTRDRSLFLALPQVGPNFPGPSTHREVIAQAERAASDAPDSPEHWLLLGQLLSHYGAAASQSDWAVRSAEALDHAIGLDSSFAVAAGHRVFTALLAQDDIAAAHYAKIFEAHVTAGFNDDMILWAAARALGDDAGAERWRAPTEGLTRLDHFQKLTKIPLHSVAFALPLGDARLAISELARGAISPEERGGALLVDLAVRYAEGIPLPKDVSLQGGAGWAVNLIEAALVEPAYGDVADDVIVDESAGDYLVGSPAGPMRWPPVQSCFAELRRVSQGDTSNTRDALRRLRAFEALDPAPLPDEQWASLDFRVCTLLLEVLLETPPAIGPWPRLDELDAMMREGPRWLVGWASVVPSAFANFTVARLREAQGDLPAALAAIRRREVDYYPAYLWTLPAFLRQEGRLAALSGDRAGAMAAYDRYLTLRTDPMPALRAQRDSVVSERAALGSEQDR